MAKKANKKSTKGVMKKSVLKNFGSIDNMFAKINMVTKQVDVK